MWSRPKEDNGNAITDDTREEQRSGLVAEMKEWDMGSSSGRHERLTDVQESNTARTDQTKEKKRTQRKKERKEGRQKMPEGQEEPSRAGKRI